MRLVADVGGTNTRFGLSRNGALDAGSIESFRNDDFPDFDCVMERYLSGRVGTGITDAVVAVAGPVHGGSARLTNRDWSFDETHLSRQLGRRPFVLLNDLAALGQAVGMLGPDSLEPVLSSASEASEDGQALVVGVGTGFNVSPVIIANGRVASPEVEYGHISLPVNIAKKLFERFGEAASGFTTIEQVFSGRGFAALSDLEQSEQCDLVSPRDQGFEVFYATLLADLARNLMMAFLPRKGMFFAGGVARRLLTSPSKVAFAATVQAPFSLNTVRMAPVHTILEDAAALKGCALYTG